MTPAITSPVETLNCGWRRLKGGVCWSEVCKPRIGALFAGRKVYVQGLDNDINTSVFTYGLESVNPDEYYNENLGPKRSAGRPLPDFGPLSKLTPGPCCRNTPGQITYFKFKGFRGYFDEPPPIPGWNP